MRDNSTHSAYPNKTGLTFLNSSRQEGWASDLPDFACEGSICGAGQGGLVLEFDQFEGLARIAGFEWYGSRISWFSRTGTATMAKKITST